MKKENKRDGSLHSAFVNTMVEKLDKKEVSTPQTLVIKDVKRDPELKPSSLYMRDEDEKKVEEHIKRMKDSIK